MHGSDAKIEFQCLLDFSDRSVGCQVMLETE